MPPKTCLRKLLAMLVFVTSSALSGAARAQSPSPAETAVAETLFKKGRELLEAGKVSEACPKLAESQRIDPRLGTLLNLAACHAQEGKIASAWAEFTDAATKAERAGQQERAKLAHEQARELEKRLSFVSITVADADRANA